jgi:hypothetical protein
LSLKAKVYGSRSQSEVEDTDKDPHSVEDHAIFFRCMVQAHPIRAYGKLLNVAESSLLSSWEGPSSSFEGAHLLETCLQTSWHEIVADRFKSRATDCYWNIQLAVHKSSKKIAHNNVANTN